MKQLFAFIISIFIYVGTVFADDRLALMYNIIPDDDSKKNSVIDSKLQKKLSFKLYKAQGDIYFNGKTINVSEGKFEIDISGLVGKQDLIFTNSENEEAIFTYYISDKNGFVKDYLLENKETYIKTLNNVKILYTKKDAKKIDYIETIIAKMPSKTKANLKEIKLLPTEHSSKAAGITDYNKVTLYNISNYNNSEIQRIVTHEIAHTWAHELRKNKIIDYSYTKFQDAIKADKNFVTKYSKNSASEDFADSIAFYLSDTKTFTKKFPARANYIANLL